MARREIELTIAETGADRGKVFYIRRLSAWDADQWGRRVIYGLLHSRAEIEGLDPDLGLAGLAELGLQLLFYIEPEVADGLLNTLTSCVFRRPDARNPAVEVPLLSDDIEDIATLTTLREAAFRLHIDFFTGVARLFSPDGTDSSRGETGAGNLSPA